MEEEATRIQFAHLNQQTVVSCSCRRRSDGGAAGGEQGPASEFQSGGGESGPALLVEAGEVQGGASAAGSGGEPASCAFQGGGESGSVSGSGGCRMGERGLK